MRCSWTASFIRDALSRNYGFIPNTLCGDGRSARRDDHELASGGARKRRALPSLRRAGDGRRWGQGREILALPGHKLTAMYDKIHDIGDCRRSRSSA